jgi:hypothetical protein
MTCQIDCFLLANSDGTMTNGICNCLSGYFWNPLASECNVNCTSYAYSEEGIVESMGCICITNFIWVYTPAPPHCTIDCGSLGYTNDPTNPANCICIPPTQTFSFTTFTCS